ncbi:MAG TPA: hypothetical protein VMS56_15475 [Thermoanaerobaculia bacterium]|nr:hypothetical protein [Thermoanaerobaculia bacterium]
MANAEEVCIGCGVAPVVQVNERKLCGNCFLLGISVSLQSTVSHSAELESVIRSHSADEAPIHELRSTLLAAIDEIQRLRARLDEIVRDDERFHQQPPD